MKTEIFLVSLTAFALLACNSPLLEHAQARDPGPTMARSQQRGDCPLAFPEHGMCAELTWDQTPTDQDPASFSLRFWTSQEGTAQGPYASPSDTVYVKLWMPSMGHGSAPIILVQAKDNVGQVISGVYLGSYVNFVMPGMWQVKIQLKQGTAVSEEADLDIQI
jgi:hypothetical protein